MKIYTKTGDDGTTGLLAGIRVSKCSMHIQAIGEVDELNSCIGLARASGHSDLDPLLSRVQHWLFDLGSELAAPGDGRWELFSHAESATRELERSMDEMTPELPPLKNFILPGGSPLAAHLHHARTVCRRAERKLLELHQESPIRAESLIFLNRLSDWLFTAARTANARQGVSDVIWQKPEDS